MLPSVGLLCYLVKPRHFSPFCVNRYIQAKNARIGLTNTRPLSILCCVLVKLRHFCSPFFVNCYIQAKSARIGLIYTRSLSILFKKTHCQMLYHIQDLKTHESRLQVSKKPRSRLGGISKYCLYIIWFSDHTSILSNKMSYSA